MKRLLVLIFIILISSVSAVRINEVEMNPSGTDSGNEWVELYSEEEINLQDYKLINNDGGEINLNEIFSGYYLFIFEKQWLDNSDEKVLLYKGDKVIDETPIFKDKNNDIKTWQFCDGEWVFNEQTKGKENKCEDEKESEEEEGETNKEENNEGEYEEEDIKEIIEVVGNADENPESQKNEEVKPIVLNPQNIKTEVNSGKENGNRAVYSFMAFSVLLAFLFWIKRKKYRNEFT